MTIRPLWLFWLACALLLAVAGCLPAADPEPTSDLAGATTTPATATPAAGEPAPPPSPTPLLVYDYPGAPGYTPTPDVYPWPTQTPGPTDPPEPTEEPTATEEPFPTLPPTPIVTVVPTAAPPFIPFPEGTTAQPFTIYYREGDAIYALSSAEGAAPQRFLDPLAEFKLYLPPSAEVIRDWGALSPDGQSLALVLTEDPVSYVPYGTDGAGPAPHPTDIYLFDMASRALRLLVADGFLPVWSPDGQRLAYRSMQTLGLWVADVATGVTHEVYAVDPPAYGEDSHYVDSFVWAADSRRLAVFHTAPYEWRDLLIVDAEGLPAPRRVETDLYHPFGVAQWSPVDDRLAVTRTGEGRQPLRDLWIMNGDLTGQRQLTYGLEFPSYSYGPLWSADGRWIAISGMAAYEAEYATYDLWLIDPDSGALHRLTYDIPAGSYEEFDHTGGEGPLWWSPDGTQLVYQKDTYQLWLLSLIDGRQRQLLQSQEVLYDNGFILGP